MKHKKGLAVVASPFVRRYYTARCTLPLRRQRVQTLIRRGVPFTIALTRWVLGAHVRLVLMLLWLTLWPVARVFPHISHFAGIASTSLNSCKVH